MKLLFCVGRTTVSCHCHTCVHSYCAVLCKHNKTVTSSAAQAQKRICSTMKERLTGLSLMPCPNLCLHNYFHLLFLLQDNICVITATGLHKHRLVTQHKGTFGLFSWSQCNQESSWRVFIERHQFLFNSSTFQLQLICSFICLHRTFSLY